MMQQALAPAPHSAHNMPQENAAEQSSWFSNPSAPPHQNGHAEFQTDLREQLLGQVGPPHPHRPTGMDNLRPSSSASPHDHNIDPAIAGPGMSVSASATNNESGAEEAHGDGSGRKGSKRELSTSKRAAQNRAAQRAFRQRKEGYIKKLEEQVRDLHLLEENYKAVQAENYQLRDYIINLQSRLIESQGDYPQPPSNIDLPHPRPDASSMTHHPLAAPTAPMVPSAESQLQASAAQAQAVAEMGNGKHHHHHHHHDDATTQQQHMAAAAVNVVGATTADPGASSDAGGPTGNGYPSKRLKSNSTTNDFEIAMAASRVEQQQQQQQPPPPPSSSHRGMPSAAGAGAGAGAGAAGAGAGAPAAGVTATAATVGMLMRSSAGTRNNMPMS